MTISLNRRHLMAAAALSQFFKTSSALAADAFPVKPVHIIVPYPAGGSVDVAMRILGEELTKTLRQPVVVENKPGGRSRSLCRRLRRNQPTGTPCWRATPASSQWK